MQLSLDWSPGLFCYVAAVVGFVHHCEITKSSAYVKFTGGLYDDGSSNWWNSQFEPIGQPEENLKIPDDHVIHQMITNSMSTISREEASAIFEKYIRPRQFLIEKINQFQKDNMEGHHIIGVHYRGTDKCAEAFRLKYEDLVKAIKKEYTAQSIVFVATDDNKCLEFVKKRFRVIHTDAIRSNNDQAIHHGKNWDEATIRGSQLAHEAIIDCWLLAKCNVLLKTHSNLSSMSININPSMRQINLNKYMPHLEQQNFR